jgi:hypothetical protein
MKLDRVFIFYLTSNCKESKLGSELTLVPIDHIPCLASFGIMNENEILPSKSVLIFF